MVSSNLTAFGYYERMEHVARQEHWICRRQTPRFRLGIPARLITLERHLSVVLQDLSETGAGVALPAAHEFTVCVLRWMDFHAFAEVRWVRDNVVGLQFAGPLPLATLEQTVRDAPSIVAEPTRKVILPRSC